MNQLVQIILLYFLVNFYNSNKIERVLFLGIDGGGSYHNLINTPNVHKLLKSGVYCDHGRAMDPTWSGQNWGSILHGVVPDKHGLDNGIAEKQPYPEDSPYPSVFKIIHQHNESMRMASFAAWNPINTGIIELSVPMLRVHRNTDDEIIVDMLNYLKSNGSSTQFMFYYFLDVDETGHKYGWLSRQYIERYKKTDKYIEIIMNVLESEQLIDSTLVIITADHGGIFKGHGGTSIFERSILFGMSGPGIPGKKLGYRAVRNMDAAAVVLKSLNIPIPTNFDAKFPNFSAIFG